MGLPGVLRDARADATRRQGAAASTGLNVAQARGSWSRRRTDPAENGRQGHGPGRWRAWHRRTCARFLPSRSAGAGTLHRWTSPRPERTRRSGARERWTPSGTTAIAAERSLSPGRSAWEPSCVDTPADRNAPRRLGRRRRPCNSWGILVSAAHLGGPTPATFGAFTPAACPAPVPLERDAACRTGAEGPQLRPRTRVRAGFMSCIFTT